MQHRERDNLFSGRLIPEKSVYGLFCLFLEGKEKSSPDRIDFSDDSHSGLLKVTTTQLST